MKKGSTNPELVSLIRGLRKASRENQAGVWRALADRLSRPGQGRAAVNLGRINRHTGEGETVVVPGKVLGAGRIDHPVNVAAFAFSDRARAEILRAKGRCLSIPELVEKAPKGSGVRILG